MGEEGRKTSWEPVYSRCSLAQESCNTCFTETLNLPFSQINWHCPYIYRMMQLEGQFTFYNSDSFDCQGVWTVIFNHTATWLWITFLSLNVEETFYAGYQSDLTAWFAKTLNRGKRAAYKDVARLPAFGCKVQKTSRLLKRITLALLHILHKRMKY